MVPNLWLIGGLRFNSSPPSFICLIIFYHKFEICLYEGMEPHIAEGVWAWYPLWAQTNPNSLNLQENWQPNRYQFNKLLTHQFKYCLLCTSFKLIKLLLHVPSKVPVWLLWSNVYKWILNFTKLEYRRIG